MVFPILALNSTYDDRHGLNHNASDLEKAYEREPRRSCALEARRDAVFCRFP